MLRLVDSSAVDCEAIEPKANSNFSNIEFISPLLLIYVVFAAAVVVIIVFAANKN